MQETLHFVNDSVPLQHVAEANMHNGLYVFT